MSVGIILHFLRKENRYAMFFVELKFNIDLKEFPCDKFCGDECNTALHICIFLVELVFHSYQ